MDDTIDETGLAPPGVSAALPGLVFIFSGGEPCFRVVGLPGRSFVIGRDVDGWSLPDERVSREHAVVSFDGQRWSVRDLGSRNGVFVDGDRQAEHTGTPRLLRVGHTLVLLRSDARPYLARPLRADAEAVVGPVLAQAYAEIDAASAAGGPLLIQGDTGSGKELAARRFQAGGPNAKGPFVAVNCATLPHALAESLLFGARKGAYSGATADTEGFVQSSHGGVLFLDEIAELEPEVQAKLLRVLEAREVQPLGAQRPRPVDVQVCAATHADLRLLAACGDFRADLYYRLGQRRVRLPPLTERIEEIPWLISGELSHLVPLAVHARFAEVCALRAWPGNVRELRAEVRKAHGAARAANSAALRAEHLDPLAGRPLSFGVPSSTEPQFGEARALPPEPALSPAQPLTLAVRDAGRQALVRALEQTGGNRREAARLLGVSRSTFYIKLKEYGID